MAFKDFTILNFKLLGCLELFLKTDLCSLKKKNIENMFNNKKNIFCS